MFLSSVSPLSIPFAFIFKLHPNAIPWTQHKSMEVLKRLMNALNSGANPRCWEHDEDWIHRNWWTQKLKSMIFFSGFTNTMKIETESRCCTNAQMRFHFWRNVLPFGLCKIDFWFGWFEMRCLHTISFQLCIGPVWALGLNRLFALCTLVLEPTPLLSEGFGSTMGQDS